MFNTKYDGSGRYVVYTTDTTTGQLPALYQPKQGGYAPSPQPVRYGPGANNDFSFTTWAPLAPEYEFPWEMLEDEHDDQLYQDFRDDAW